MIVFGRTDMKGNPSGLSLRSNWWLYVWHCNRATRWMKTGSLQASSMPSKIPPKHRVDEDSWRDLQKPIHDLYVYHNRTAIENEQAAYCGSLQQACRKLSTCTFVPVKGPK